MKSFIINRIKSIGRNAFMPKNVDALITEIKAKGPQEWMPGETHFTHNGNVHLCYETIGEAKRGTIFIISGLVQTLLGYPKHLHEGFLEAGYRVVRMDNRGVGQSSWMNNWSKENAYTLEDMASDVIAVMDDLNLPEAHIAGISMGGMIAQSVAINYPKRVQSLISIMSTGHLFDPELTGIPTDFRGQFTLITLLHGLNISTVDQRLRFRCATFSMFKGKGDYEMDIRAMIDKGLYELIKRSGYNVKAFDQQGAAVKKSGSRYEGLKKLNVPTLVIHGTDDPLIKIAHSKKYAPMIPNAKTLFVEGMGHDVPAIYMPQINAAMLELLASVEVEAIA